MQLHTVVVSPHGRKLALVLGCYLIQTSDGTNILVDSGLPAGYQQPGVPPLEHARTVIECLADLNLHPDDIDILVCTHFDVDHAGHHDAFSRAEFVV
jgi:N-acyl homoserine lactone hydrolase